LKNYKLTPLKDLVSRVKVGFVGSINEHYCERDNGVPIIRTTDLSEVEIEYGNLKYVTKEFHLKNRKSQLQRGDIIVARHGDNGKANVYRKSTPAQVLNAVIITPDQNKLSSEILKLFLESPFIRKQVKGSVKGSVQGVINTKHVADLLLPISDDIDYNKCSNLISTIDKQITLNNRINAELESLALTIYDYWFLQFDFPGADGRPYRSSGGEMNEDRIPEGWTKDNIMVVADLLGGGTPSKKNKTYWNGDIPFFTPTDAKANVFSLDTDAHTTDEGITNCSSKLFEPGTIFITARGSVGRLAIAGKAMGMNQSCYALKAKQGISPAYLYFKTQELIKHLKVKSSGSVFNSIVSNDIDWTVLTIPDLTIIQAFSSIATPMFEQIATLTQENAELSSLRDWLLPLLMSGEVVVGE
jgi:type I restriction enzyme S subunit